MIANQFQRYDFSKPSGLACDSADQLSLWIANCCGLMKEMWSDLASTPRSFHAKFSEAATFQKVREKLPPTSIAYQILIGDQRMVTMLIAARDLALTYAWEMVGESCDKLPEDRELSPVEFSLIELFFQRTAERFGTAWPKKEPIVSRLDSRVDQPHRSRVYDPDEILLAYKFVGEASFGPHEFLWLAPQQALEEMLSEPSPLQAFTNNDTRERIEDLARLIPVNVSIVLGEAKIPVADLPNLSVGDVVVLDRRIEEPVTVNVANEPKFSGWPGRKGPRYAVQIKTVF